MIAWDESLSIGVKAIDDQHRAIINLVNTLEANKNGGDEVAAANTLRFLRNYLNEHFAAEIELMRRHGYPKLDEHHEQHEQFVNHVIFFEIEKAFDAPPAELLTGVLAFLKEWCLCHISKEDKALGEFLKDQASCA